MSADPVAQPKTPGNLTTAATDRLPSIDFSLFPCDNRGRDATTVPDLRRGRKRSWGGQTSWQEHMVGIQYRIFVRYLPMRFAVVPMRRQGRRMDRHELANREPVVGDLSVEEVRDESLGRYVRMARVVDRAAFTGRGP